MNTNLLSYTLDDLKALFTTMGEEPFRAKQVFQWIYHKGVASIENMSNIPRSFRNKLISRYNINTPIPHHKTGNIKTTIKYAFMLEDEYIIEAAVINMQPHLTLCISTQVGCKCGCIFCKSGEKGFFRNLKVEEIIGQVLCIKRDIAKAKKRFRNIVFMGIGEPLYNYENLYKSIIILQNEFGLNISPRRITVSTAGIIPGLIRLGKDFPLINVAISLNAPTDKLRSKIMPINRKYPLKKLREICFNYPLPERKRITFEYVMIKDINDSLDCAKALVNFVKGLKCKVNLIPYNESEAMPYISSTTERIQYFQDTLHENNISATIRKSKGKSIHAACGQLAVSLAKNAKKM